jgi:hypothetical protein
VPTLGRMLALAGGDEALARLVVPLLRDVLASQTSGADAEVGVLKRWCPPATPFLHSRPGVRDSRQQVHALPRNTSSNRHPTHP